MKLPFTCECGKPFETSENCHFVNLEAAKKAGMTSLHFECRHCRLWVEYNPVTGKPVPAKSAASRSSKTYRCPVAGCAGWVSRVKEDDERPFWGCGECGSVWYRPVNLRKDIDRIIKRYPYRKNCYRKVEGKWEPGAPDKEPRGYERKVEREEPDESEDYERG